jgi:hypothetical protein
MKEYKSGDINFVLAEDPHTGTRKVRFYFPDKGGFEMRKHVAHQFAEELFELTKEDPLPDFIFPTKPEPAGKTQRKGKKTA